MKSMNELILHFLQDIYYAEKKGVSNTKKVAKAIENPALKEAVLQHGELGKSQIERLATAFESLNRRPRGKTCAAMDGLVKECEEAIEEGERGPILDSALLACLQAIEHYEIARYGAMIAWCKSSGNTEAAPVLQEILDEEKACDAKLNEIANTMLNLEAAQETEGEEDEDEAEEADEAAPDESPAEDEPEDEPEEAPKPAPKRRAAKAAAPAPEKAPTKKQAAKPAPKPAAKPRRKSA